MLSDPCNNNQKSSTLVVQGLCCGCVSLLLFAEQSNRLHGSKGECVKHKIKCTFECIYCVWTDSIKVRCSTEGCSHNGKGADQPSFREAPSSPLSCFICLSLHLSFNSFNFLSPFVSSLLILLPSFPCTSVLYLTPCFLFRFYPLFPLSQPITRISLSSEGYHSFSSFDMTCLQN